jgi:SAM-dependent methyltransferase
MLELFLPYLRRPNLCEESTCKFWDDEHISKGMLEAHLDPHQEGASRKHSFIEESVAWISNICPPQCYPKLVDLGCGPGLYVERLFKKGYKVTGIDFSQRSIAYAEEEARKKDYNIEYLYKNYLDINYKNEFNLAIMIYCDFGALCDKSRNTLLRKVHDALSDGGVFIFDVFTPHNYKDKGESFKWYLNEGSGFWRPDSHLCLEAHYIYENNTRADQYVIIDNSEKVDVVRVWDHYYTRETILKELLEAGFKGAEIYGDASGTPYFIGSKTMCIAAHK